MTTTRNQRAAAIGIGLPWRGMLPVPDGAVEIGDRAQVAFMYRFGTLVLLPSGRYVIRVAADNRHVSVRGQYRNISVAGDDRTTAVHGQDRTISVNAQHRVIRVPA